MHERIWVFALVSTLAGLSASGVQAQPGHVLSHQKISDTLGGFTGTLDDFDEFGSSTVSLGDIDGNGVSDLAVGALGDDDGGLDRGAVWVLFLNADGTLKSQQKISDTEGGFAGVLDDLDRFGVALASLGDIDGDGINDLAVGAFLDDDGVADSGAVWVLFLNVDGTVKSHQKISNTEGGFTGELSSINGFGVSLASLGDLDNDGISDLAVGAHADDDGGSNQGAVWILFLNADGTVRSHQKISETTGGFTGDLDSNDWFGISVAPVDDLDGDGVCDLAVGVNHDDDGGGNHGAVWVLFLNIDGTVRAQQKISDTEGGFTGMLDLSDSFGHALASLNDLDGDGIGDLAVGVYLDDDGGVNRGAVWLLFLNGDGTVKSHQKISCTDGGFIGDLDDHDAFGISLGFFADLDENGSVVPVLAAGAVRDDDGGPDRGAVWVLFLDGAFEECVGAGDGAQCADDGVECTDDVCISEVCNHLSFPADTACGDPTDSDCDNPNTCDGSETCLDNLEPLGTPCPDDGNPCTENVCDGAGACEHPNDDTNDCDDGAFCNGNERCQSGECVDGPNPCVDQDHCDGQARECLECVPTDECDDDNVCTTDRCDPTTGCVYTPECVSDADCGGGSVCTAEGCCEEDTDACSDDDGDGKVTICHIPPGNPRNARTMSVRVRAVLAHLTHGDHCGPCEGNSFLQDRGRRSRRAKRASGRP